MTHYKTLGVETDADDKAISAAYKKLAKQHHPDLGGDENMFKKVTEAYETLKDPEKRQEYDLTLNPSRGFSGNGGAYAGGNFRDPYHFSTIFDDINVETPFMHTQQPLRDVDVPYHVTLEDVYHGKETDITYTIPGSGRKKLSIKIPRGIDDGKKIRYKNEGEKRGERTSDLYIIIHENKHPRFERKGNDLFLKTDVSAIDAILGKDATIECIDGTVLKVRIPEGTQHGQKVRLKGKGMPIFRANDFGDLYIVINIVIPKNITKEQRDLLEQF